ncbi:hypothetical protein FQN57_005573 [Myotisia sp. PD_48]|nr:hypothetical protein FQN57_005573 [Myotisia sp. PD_48]
MPQPFVFRGNPNGGGQGRRDAHDGYNRPPNPHHEFTFRYSASTRPLLRTRREMTPEFLGSNDKEPTAKKFMSLEDITDSDEADMDESSADSESSQPPRKKRAIGVQDAPPPPSAPKWSNPDPYTVLPPEEERQGKKRDFVKLIRKARIASTTRAEEANDAVTANEDFISLDAGNMPPENAPTGPRALELGRSDSALGNRKRTYNDEIVAPVRRGVKPLRFFNADGSLLDRWKSRLDQNPAPWFNQPTRQTHLGMMLHNEVLDFYHWVKPMPYEDLIRRDLISRLQALVEKRFFGCRLSAFGSFASGLYLPTADMDLVLLSRQYMQQGRKYLCQKVRDIYSFAEFIRQSGMAVSGSIETIAHARVPIIKFVDDLTGLKVDLSFDNNSGLSAIETFESWKREHPAMPVIVSIIKQFLLLRGLNEVPTGGLGGFSIICLVTSMLQHLPQGVGEPNFGSLLMDFFDFYGSKFNFSSVGIQFNPPGYFYKKTHGIYQSDKKNRLSIRDPNDPDNDISGGTQEIPRIFRAFDDAYITLRDNLNLAAYGPSTATNSFLEPILGADYDSYAIQRSRLEKVFREDPRFSHYHLPSGPYGSSPPPPPPSLSPPPPPPGLSSKEKTSLAARSSSEGFGKKKQAAFDRAARLRRLRPDIAESVPMFVDVELAVKLGGYENSTQMDRDLSARLKEQDLRNKQTSTGTMMGEIREGLVV